MDWRELWEFRDLLRALIVKEYQVRYKQTLLGVAWAILQPFMTMVVMTIVFGYLARMPSNGLPYPVFSYAALVAWNYFSKALVNSSASLVDNRVIISKVYFPRILLPVAPIMSGVPDLLIALFLLLGIMLWYGVHPGPSLLLLPLFFVLAGLTAMGIGLWIAPLNAHFRDFQAIVPFALQIWLYLSPIVYPASIVPARFQALYNLNPMAVAIEGCRWCLLKSAAPSIPSVIGASLLVLAVNLSGFVFFRRMESTLVDVA